MSEWPKVKRGPFQGDYEPPDGVLGGTFKELMAAGCIQAETVDMLPMFRALMIGTHKNPCNGCPAWAAQGPKCRAFRVYHSVWREHEAAAAKRTAEALSATEPHNVPVGHPLAGLSIKSIAKRLGVSIAEVRRRKAAGAL